MGPSFGDISAFLTAEFTPRPLPNAALVDQALSENYTPTSESATELNQVSLDGQFTEVVFGSGFGSSPDPTISNLLFYHDGQEIWDSTFSSTIYSITTFDGVNTGVVNFTGSDLPTDANSIEALDSFNPAQTGNVNDFSQVLNGTTIGTYILSPGGISLSFGDFTVFETGSLPTSVSSAFISYQLFGVPFTFPNGTVSGIQIDDGAASVGNLNNGSIEYSALTDATTSTSLVDLVLGDVSSVDASASGSGVVIDARAGGSIGVLGDSPITHSSNLALSSVIGSDADDSLTGDTAAELFEGGGGNDIIAGNSGHDSAVYSGPRADYTIARTGAATLTITDNRSGSLDGTDTLSGVASLQFANETIGANLSSTSLEGAAESDILWRNTDGTIAEWQMNNSGGVAAGLTFGQVPTSWTVAGVGDVNGDGRADILWRNSDGTVAEWQMNGSGGVASTQTFGPVPTSWSIVGVGDFNGDGSADLLWRNTDGTVAEWQMNNSGGIASTQVLGQVPLSWAIAGIGDLNGDGRSDIVWRNSDGTVAEWLMNGAGGVASTDTFGPVPTAWSIVGVGDVNGDGTADLIWQNGGTVAEWQMNGSGGIASTQTFGPVDPTWSLVGVGDYNGDGRADLLWQNVSGAVAEWQMNASGSVGQGAVVGSVTSSWTAQHDNASTLAAHG
ncbi:MAG TPA: VCBS repeat-containing protein [Stellaceae bacterium]|nr:VCBS repeat-containing protein [Stellaceae bacterium]